MPTDPRKLRPSELCRLLNSTSLGEVLSERQAVLRGGLFAMAMPRGSGKALALDTPLPTPFGWTTMGEVKPGDYLFDEEGWPCRVTFATEVHALHGEPTAENAMGNSNK